MWADALSRSHLIASEWSLDQSSFNSICQRFGIPQIDMFATKENSKLESFGSPVRDEQAFSFNAFTLDWNAWERIYLYPPMKLIMRTLSHLESFRETAWLVTPLWPGQPWFTPVQTRAKDMMKLHKPILSQIVRGQRTFCNSRILLQLVGWKI